MSKRPLVFALAREVLAWVVGTVSPGVRNPLVVPGSDEQVRTDVGAGNGAQDYPGAQLFALAPRVRAISEPRDPAARGGRP